MTDRSPMIPFPVLDMRRQQIRELAEDAMDLTAAATKYRWWTGGRDPGPKYSSCGDLPHRMLWLQGCRADWVNVAEREGGFRYGKNITLLMRKPIGVNPIAVEYKGQPLLTGDIVISWPDKHPEKAHTCIVDRVDGFVLHTWDFGQGPMSPDLWRTKGSHVESARRARVFASFPIRSVIRLADVPFTATPTVLDGSLIAEMEAFK